LQKLPSVEALTLGAFRAHSKIEGDHFVRLSLHHPPEYFPFANLRITPVDGAGNFLSCLKFSLYPPGVDGV
jgi:hypothetical protein